MFMEEVGGRFKDVCVFLRATFFFYINASRGEVNVVIWLTVYLASVYYCNTKSRKKTSGEFKLKQKKSEFSLFILFF